MKIFIIIFFPLLLLLINNEWIITHPSVGNVDPWVYLGFFLDFSNHIREFNVNSPFVEYFGTRFAWIFPGALVYKIFSPLTANYVLHLTFLYVTLFSVYFIIKTYLESKTALFAVIILCGYTFFLRSIGWDHVTCPVNAYYLLTLLTLTWATNSRRREVLYFLAGIFLSLTIYTHLFFIIFIPPLLVYTFFSLHKARVRLQFHHVVCFIVGIIATTLCFCIVYYIMTDKIFFLMPQIRVASGLLSYNRFRLPFPDWVFKSTHLVIPTLIFMFSIVLLGLHNRRQRILRNNTVTMFQFLYVMTFLEFVMIEAIGGHALEYWFYVAYLVPTMFLAFASPFTYYFSKINNSLYSKLIAFTIVLVLIPFVFFSNNLLTTFAKKHIIALLSFSTLVIIWWYYSSIFSSVYTQKSKVVSWSFILLVSAYSIINFTLSPLRDFSNPYHHTRKEALLGVTSGIRSVIPLNQDCKLRFWYNLDDPNGYIFKAINSAFLWRHRCVNTMMPILQQRDIMRHGIVYFHTVKKKDKIIILSTDDSSLQLALKNLSTINYNAKVISEVTVHERNVKFKMIVVRNEDSI